MFSKRLQSTQTFSKTTKMSKSVSLVQKEDSFFNDAFFKDAWEDFDTAMQSVLTKFEDKSSQVDVGSRTNCQDAYRKIRSSKINDDLYASQALQVTEKDGKFQCVMDVKDFNPADLQVKVVDDRVVVEGKYEQKSEEGNSASLVTKCFFKEFNLPTSADIDQIGTALSKDGILTIKAPKKDGVEATTTAGPVSKTQSSSMHQSSSSSSSSVKQDGNSSLSSSSSVQKSSFSSSSFSSSSSSFSSSSFSNQSNQSLLGGMQMPSIGDLEKDMKDRLVFSHENFNVKLPESK